jgi:hypothetical protein
MARGERQLWSCEVVESSCWGFGDELFLFVIGWY